MADEKEEYYATITKVDLANHRQQVAHVTPGGDNAIDNLVRTLQVITEVVKAEPISNETKSLPLQRQIVNTLQVINEKCVVGKHVKDLNVGVDCREVGIDEWIASNSRDPNGDDSCPSCLFPWAEKPSELVIVCQCGKAICLQCILNMLERAYDRQCPMCRASLKLSHHIQSLLVGNDYAHGFIKAIEEQDKHVLIEKRTQWNEYQKNVQGYMNAIFGFNRQQLRRHDRGLTQLHLRAFAQDIEMIFELRKYIDPWMCIYNMSANDALATLKSVINIIYYMGIITNHRKSYEDAIRPNPRGPTASKIYLNHQNVEIKPITNVAKVWTSIQQDRIEGTKKRVVRCYIKNGYITEKEEIIHGMKVILFGTLEFAILFLHPQREVQYATGLNNMLVVEVSEETQIKRKLLATTDAQRKLNNRKHFQLQKQEKTLGKRAETLAKHEENYVERRKGLTEDKHRFDAHVKKTLDAIRAREWNLARAEELKGLAEEQKQEQRQTPTGLDAAIEAEFEEESKDNLECEEETKAETKTQSTKPKLLELSGILRALQKEKHESKRKRSGKAHSHEVKDKKLDEHEAEEKAYEP
ncbi:MAG: hypothetical protein GY938_22945, partial [Ketobacter sp.]|nr:hypothetical protein [Ketobacter sp.]